MGPVKKIIERLVKDKVAPVAAGRAEFGPRAFGNRSILADPRYIEIKDKVNLIKIDVDSDRGVAAAYGVNSVPTFVALKNGNLVDHYFFRHNNLIGCIQKFHKIKSRT
jgi:predicted NodU family carbamoyl transferase